MEFHTIPLEMLNSKIRYKIIDFLITHEQNMSEREISSVLNVSHMSVNRTMKELEDLNFVHFIRVGNAHLWKVNKKSYAYKSFQKAIETKNIFLGSTEEEDFLAVPLINKNRDAVFGILLLSNRLSNGREKFNKKDIDVARIIGEIASECMARLLPIQLPH